MNIEKEYKEKIIGILSVLFPKAKIILFGSRAQQTHVERSDIDIAVDAGYELRPHQIGEAKAMFEVSTIPYPIDVVDMQNIPPALREQIIKDGIVWKN